MAHLPETAISHMIAMPWESPMTRLLEAMTGPMARISATIGILAFFLSFYLGGSVEFMRRVGLIGLGGGIALVASRIVGFLG